MNQINTYPTNLFTKVTKEQVLEGDVVKIEFINQKKSMAKSNYVKLEEVYEKIEHCIYRNEEFVSVIDYEKIKFIECLRTEYYLHNYKYVVKDKNWWFIEGTESYPNDDVYTEYIEWIMFQGLTYKENFNEMKGIPHWDDSIICQFDEFIITERINQTRHRKLLRLI